MAAQAPLVAVAERLANLDQHGTGLAGIQLNVQQRAVVVWWKGDVPAGLRDEMARQRSDEGVSIELRPAKYSQRELKDAVQTVAANRDAYPGFTRVGPLVDGSGLEVGLTDISRAGALKFPVDTKVVLAPPIVAKSRANDSPPWWAGGVTIAAGATESFSTGFAVYRLVWGFLWIESTGILTADHCFTGGQVVFNNGVGVSIGTAEPTPAGPLARRTGSLYIVTNSQGRTFDGGVGVGEFSKPVIGFVQAFPGTFVCTSGAASGAHCNISVNSINNVVVLFPIGAVVEGVTLANELSGSVATADGDSGGPVFTLDTNSSNA